jgi:hypothetical protein
VEPFFPSGSNLYVVFGVFAFLLVVFHWVLVRWLRLSSADWKIVDYVWLGFAALGLFSAAGQVRTLAATAQLSMLRDRTAYQSSDLQRLITSLQKRNGNVCGRTFIPSEGSPPPEKLNIAEREYNLTCEWVDKLASAIPPRELPTCECVSKPGSGIPGELPKTPQIISPDSLPRRPGVSSGDLKQTIDGFYRQLEWYNQAVVAFDADAEAAKLRRRDLDCHRAVPSRHRYRAPDHKGDRRTQACAPADLATLRGRVD